MKTNIRIKKLIYTKNIIIFVKRIKSYFQFIKENVNKSDMVMSASDLLNKDYATNLKFEGKWGDMLGDVSPDFTMMVSGAPGSGKTTFLLEFAYYLASNFGHFLSIVVEKLVSNLKFQVLVED